MKVSWKIQNNWIILVSHVIGVHLYKGCMFIRTGDAKSLKIANLGFPSTFVLRARKKPNKTGVPWGDVGKSMIFLFYLFKQMC